MIPLIRESQNVSESLKYSGGVLGVGLNVCLALNSVNSATMLVSLATCFFRSSMMSGKSVCTAAQAVLCVSDWTATFLVWTTDFSTCSSFYRACFSACSATRAFSI